MRDNRSIATNSRCCKELKKDTKGRAKAYRTPNLGAID